MAKKEHWECDPFDWKQVLERVIGKNIEDAFESKGQARQILVGIPAGLRCLEIGCGYGRLLPRMLSIFSQAFGIDWSCTMVALSTVYLRHEIFCRVMLSDGELIPYPENTFSFVYSFTCFQHMESLDTIKLNISEAYRVLSHGGLFRLQTVIGKRDVGLHDGYVFETPAELSNLLLNAGFRMTSHTIDEEKSWIWITATK